MPFSRIGASGDPSLNWEHTFKILRQLSTCNTELVIITRHWNVLSDEQLTEMSRMNLCINTSVSAVDTESDRLKSLIQFQRIKPFCKSVLRIISCSFNEANETGKALAEVQRNLFRNDPVIDTVFRPAKTNQFLTQGIITAQKHFFNGKKQLASKFNRKTYMGKCNKCVEMCGVNLSSNALYPSRPGVLKQELLAV